MLFNSVFTIFWDFNIQCRVCYTACSVNRRETVSLFKFPIKSLMIPFELNWPVSPIYIYIYIYILYVTLTSPRDRSPVRNSSLSQPSGKDHWNQGSPYNLTLLQLEQTTGLSGQRGTGPLTEPGFSQSFFSPMEFWFLAVVASGLLSWGHFISSDITDLIAQILFKLNWAGRWHHWIQ